MYRKILVPLDGSELSECSLEPLRALTTSGNITEVIILRVLEPMHSQTLAALSEAGGTLLKEIEDNRGKEAKHYIQNIATKLQNEGIKAEPIMIPGNPGDVILNYAKSNNVDLIIMSTHGRSGISRWVMGSVTNKVLNHSPIPVLIIIPKGCRISS